MASVLDLLQGHSTIDVLHYERGELITEMPAGEVILSVGCGSLAYFDWFSSKYPHKVSRHVGIDILPRPEGLPPSIEWHEGSLADLSMIPDNSIDLIFAGQAIEHVPTYEALDFFEHAHRVLRQDEWLVMDSPNFDITRVWPFPNPEHVIEYTPRQMRSILEAAGFRVAYCKGILLAIEDGEIINDPYQYERIDYRRLKEAKVRPNESFIWWIEARKTAGFDRRRVAGILQHANRSYERERVRSVKRSAQAAQASAQNPPSDSTPVARRLFRTLVPQTVRRFMRAGYRIATGWYTRTGSQRLQDVQALAETQAEITDNILRRLSRLEAQVTDGGMPQDARLAGLEEPYQVARRSSE